MTAPRPMTPGRPPRRRGPFNWRSLFRPFKAKEEGTMPAGLVLVLVVGALLIAMFLNADATLRKSEAKGDGWRNEVAKSVASVSETLHLNFFRSEVDDALGKNQGTSTDVADILKQQQATEENTADGQTDTTDAPPAPVLPQIPAPTPTEKLRFWVGGDSITQTFGTAMQLVAAGNGVIDPTLDFLVSTGLARPD